MSTSIVAEKTSVWSTQADEKQCEGDQNPITTVSLQQSFEYEALRMTPCEERKLLRRIDLWLIPYASLLYLLSFLDRVNIGQARLAGLEKGLGLKGNQYDIALTIFFVSYIIFELPSNLLLKRLRPHRWICFLVVSWSILQTCMGLITNYRGLYILRFLLGMFEAGLFPGLNFLFTTWYTRKELNIRVSFFFAGATLSGAFGGLLAYGIRHMEGIGGRDGWSWIFIIEGLLTLLCGIPALWLIQDFPQNSRLLSPLERAKWLHRLNISQGVTNASLPFTKSQIYRALTDWKTYVYSMIAFAIGQSFYSLSLFLPSIIAALGYTNATANLLSAAPFALGTVVTLISGYVSDCKSVRGPIIVATMSLSAIGYTILLCDVSPTIKYIAVFITLAGVTPSLPTEITFISNNSGPMYTRAAVLAIQFSLANISGIIASNVYPIGDAPRYLRGHATALGFSVLAVVLSAFISIYNLLENRRRDRVYGIPNPDGSDCNPVYADDPIHMKRWGLEGKTKQEILELGDLHPAFRYMI